MRRIIFILPLLALSACALLQSDVIRPALYVHGRPVHGAILNRTPPEYCLGCEAGDVVAGELTIRIDRMYVDTADVLQLQGRVEEARTGEPASAVAIGVEGAGPDTRAFTGTDGVFALRIPRRPGAVLVFRRVGIRTLQVSVDPLFLTARRFRS